MGSNPFVKYSHLKPICINKGSFLKERAHSKKIRFHLEMHTTTNFSLCSKAVQNRFISKCVLYWFATIFFPVLVARTKLLDTIASLGTPVGTSTAYIKARPWQAPTPALLWFPKERCMSPVQMGAMKCSSWVSHDEATWISSHSETHASSSVCT